MVKYEHSDICPYHSFCLIISKMIRLSEKVFWTKNMCFIFLYDLSEVFFLSDKYLRRNSCSLHVKSSLNLSSISQN